MAKKRFSHISFTGIVLFVACVTALLATLACSQKEAHAKQAVEDFLKGSQVKDIKVDSFFTSPEVPDKAYVGVTITYNFATADGQLQKEYLGYILRQSGRGYIVENHTAYTQEERQARNLLAGRKRSDDS